MSATDPPAWGPLADSAIRFLGTAQALTDDEPHDTSAPPGWTRAHVLAHVALAARLAGSTLLHPADRLFG